MTTSRRDLMKTLGAGAAALPPPATRRRFRGGETRATGDVDPASTAERELKIVNLDLLEDEARKLISPRRFAFMGPAGDGVTFRENRRAFNDYPIMPRRLQGISAQAIDLRTTLLEHELPIPMITCPMGGHGLFHANAEVATAGGTGVAGTLYVSSGAAHKPMEDIAKATPGPKWFQIYMNRDMEINRWLVQRAKAAGFSAIVLTADALGPNPADEYVRLGSFQPPGLTQGNHDPGTRRPRHLQRFQARPELQRHRLPARGLGPAGDRQGHRCSRRISGNRWRRAPPPSGSPITAAASSTACRPRSPSCGRRPTWFREGADHLRQRHPARHRRVQGAGARRHRGRGRTPGAVGSYRRRRSGVKSVYAHITGEMRAAMMLSGVAKPSDIKREHVAMVKVDRQTRARADASGNWRSNLTAAAVALARRNCANPRPPELNEWRRDSMADHGAGRICDRDRQRPSGARSDLRELRSSGLCRDRATSSTS